LRCTRTASLTHSANRRPETFCAHGDRLSREPLRIPDRRPRARVPQREYWIIFGILLGMLAALPPAVRVGRREARQSHRHSA
jgi:hypothetical protein